MKTRRVLALGLLFATAFAVGAVTTLADNRLPPNCFLPDAAIAWYNGSSGEYSGIYHGEAISDGDSWHNASVIDLTQVGGAGTNDQINSYNGFYGTTGWLGIADPKPNTSCVYGPDQVVFWNTLLNQTYLDNGYTLQNKQDVACEELGHAMGLAHTTAAGSCMNATLTAPQPNAHDIAELAGIYPGGPPPPSPTPTPPPPPQCGYDLQCFPSLRQCQAVCCGVCERRINCGGATAHKCFEN